MGRLDEIVLQITSKYWNAPSDDKGLTINQIEYYAAEACGSNGTESRRIAEALGRLEEAGRIQSIGYIKRITIWNCSTLGEAPGAMPQRRWYPTPKE